MMNAVRTTSRTYAPSRPRAGRGLFTAFFSLLSLQRSRYDLANLDQHLLNDIGLTESEAKSEAKRPVWDVPATWRL